MGGFSAMPWLIVVAAMTLMFGGGRIANPLGDLARGLKTFRREMVEDEAAAAPARLEGPGQR